MPETKLNYKLVACYFWIAWQLTNISFWLYMMLLFKHCG